MLLLDQPAPGQRLEKRWGTCLHQCAAGILPDALTSSHQHTHCWLQMGNCCSSSPADKYEAPGTKQEHHKHHKHGTGNGAAPSASKVPDFGLGADFDVIKVCIMSVMSAMQCQTCAQHVRGTLRR